MDAYHDMSHEPESWTAEDIAHQRIRFCAVWQVIEEAELVDEYEAWKEAYPNGKISVTVRPPYKSKITISEEKLAAFKRCTVTSN